MSQAFQYSDTGFPQNKRMECATRTCKAWLDRHMSMFKDKGIRNFMLNQPVRAAKMLIEKTDTPSQASVIAALLGPAKSDIMASPVSEQMARELYGNQTVNLIAYLMDGNSTDPQIIRDANRLFLVEGMSTMNDQLIGRKRIDAHHQVRWNILNDLEKHFKTVKGENPALDEIFAADLKQSRAALERLDRDAAQKKKGPTGPR